MIEKYYDNLHNYARKISFASIMNIWKRMYFLCINFFHNVKKPLTISTVEYQGIKTVYELIFVIIN